MNHVADQATWMRLADSGFIMGSEPLGRWMQHWAWLLTGSREWALRLPSFAAGFVFVAGAAWLLRDLAPAKRWSALLFLSVAPYTVFFLGYPSTCPFAYAFLGLYLLGGVRYLRLRPDRAPWSESALLALACWTHGMALWAAAAQLVLVYFWGEKKFAKPLFPIGKLVLLCTIPFLPLGLTLLYAYHFGSGLPESPWMGNATGGVNGAFVNLSGSDVHHGAFTQFGLWSRGHLLGLGGLVLRLCPGLVLVPYALRRTRERVFGGVALSGLLLLAIVWNFDLGYLADEKFALFAVPVQILLFLWLVEHSRFRWIAVGSAAAALSVILPRVLS